MATACPSYPFDLIEKVQSGLKSPGNAFILVMTLYLDQDFIQQRPCYVQQAEGCSKKHAEGSSRKHLCFCRQSHLQKKVAEKSSLTDLQHQQ